MARVKGYIMKNIMIYNGVYLKNPNPKAKPAKYVEIEDIIAYIFAIINQDTQ